MPWLPIFQNQDQEYVATVKAVARRLAPGGGIIIVFVSDDENTDEYLGEYDLWHKFNCDTRAENPITYVNLPAAYRKLERVRKEEELDIGVLTLALWVHPDVGVPLDKYIGMTGSQFPGTVRQ